MLPYTKKADGSRMGKGKGVVKNWYYSLRSGWPLFFLKNWNMNVLFFAMRKLKIFLPGKWLIFYNRSFINYFNGPAINLHNVWKK